MKKLKIISLATTILFLLFSMACNKDENENPDPQNDPQEFTVETVTIPDAMAQSQDPGAIQAASYVNMANGMSAYGAMMTPPKKSAVRLKNTNDEIVTWDMNDGSGNVYSVTLKITETSSYIRWEMIIDGTFDGLVLTNFTYMVAEEYKDGSGSSFTVYDFENPGSIFMKLTWYVSGGTTYFTLEVPQEILVTIEVNADGSGLIEVREWENGQYLLSFMAQWTVAGTGEYWEYDAGVLVDQGSW